MTRQYLFLLWQIFFLQLLQHFWTQNLADLSSYSFLIFTFSLILIEFNIGQDQNKVGDDFPGNYCTCELSSFYVNEIATC